MMWMLNACLPPLLVKKRVADDDDAEGGLEDGEGLEDEGGAEWDGVSALVSSSDTKIS